MKSRLVILSMLVLGMLLSTAGAGLAITGVTGIAAEEQYGTPPGSSTPSGGGNVLGDEDSGTNAQPEDTTGGGKSPGGGEGNGGVQPARQAEAGANTTSRIPFTGFAAIPILLGGAVLLSAGLVLRRRTGSDR